MWEEVVHQAARHVHVIEGVREAPLGGVGDKLVPHLGHRLQDNAVHLAVEPKRLCVKTLPGVVFLDIFPDFLFKLLLPILRCDQRT